MLWLLGFICLSMPVSGQIVNGYEPDGRYAGHWGVDIAVPVGTSVQAPLAGSVVFAGSVAGTMTVTIETEGMKVSLSYLSSISVSGGDHVAVGSTVGASGIDHGVPAVHMSVRVGGEYVDPALFLRCRFGPISDGLRLVPYPVGSENRNSRRHVRSAPPRPSPHGRSRLPSTSVGFGSLRSGRISLAEGGALGLVARGSHGDDGTGCGGGRVLRCR